VLEPYNPLQHTATHRDSVYASVFRALNSAIRPIQHTNRNAAVAACCSVLQCVAVCYSVWHCVAARGAIHAKHTTLEYTDGHPDVAVCCSVLQCVASIGDIPANYTTVRRIDKQLINRQTPRHSDRPTDRHNNHKRTDTVTDTRAGAYTHTHTHSEVLQCVAMG